MIFHITTRAAWDETGAGPYRAASLESEGFIHCSTEAQVERTLARFFEGQAGLVLLVIDPERLTAEVKFEAADGESFPHVYGPIDRDAVIDVRVLRP